MSNRNNFMAAEKERSVAERLRADLFRTVKVTDQMTRTRQQCNTRKLGIHAAENVEKRFMLLHINTSLLMHLLYLHQNSFS